MPLECGHSKLTTYYMSYKTSLWQNLRYGKNYSFLFLCSNGVMLLLFTPVSNGIIPMTVINVHTGNPLMNVTYEASSIRDVEFIEQFNEYLMIKSKN